MTAEQTGGSGTAPRPGTCVACGEPFERPGDRKLHVSLLGAPGEFHDSCFEEYQQSEATGLNRSE